MRVLVTGGSGFVGRHLAIALRNRLPRAATVVPTAQASAGGPLPGGHVRLDVTDPDAVRSVLRDVAPTHVVHLSGISAPRRAAEHALDAWSVNLMGTLNLAHTILAELPGCRLIFAGSGLVYGGSTVPGEAFHEASPLFPMNEYAATKAAADLALGTLALQGLNVVRLRLFNHTGPGQTEAFVVPGLAAQIARIEAGLQPRAIKVGSLEAVRDFLDVADVAEAYVQTVLRAHELPRGQVLNIASGVGRSIGSVLNDLLALSAVPIAVATDAARMEPSDRPYCVGEASLARSLLGWTPVRPFKATLSDVLAYWRQQVAQRSERQQETLVR